MARIDVRSEILTSVVERFPDRHRRILELALRDEDFRALCEEYDLARKSYSRLQVLPGRDNEVAEYRTLITELEDEIRSYLQAGRSAN
jgi:hypothetical protein